MVHISINIEFENKVTVLVTGNSITCVGVMYPRQLKFINNLNEIVKEYIKEAPKDIEWLTEFVLVV